MDIRPAAVADLPAINDIFNHYVRTSPAIYQIEPWTAEERAAWFADHDVRHPVLVAEQDDTIVGWGSLSRYSARCGYRFTVEDSLYVHPDARGRGLGRVLLNELLALGWSRGCHSVIAMIDSEQDASLSLHRNAGFRLVAHLKEVGYKFDRWRDCVFMQRLL
jgi:phosphinothricin acetyltransferase